MSARPGRGVDAVGAALAAGLLAALVGLSAWLWQGGQRPLLLAPAIGELADCLDMAPAQAPLEPACTGPRGSAAQRIEATLAGLGPRAAPRAAWPRPSQPHARVRH